MYVIAERVLYQPSTVSLASVILCERKTSNFLVLQSHSSPISDGHAAALRRYREMWGRYGEIWGDIEEMDGDMAEIEGDMGEI